MTSTPYLAAFRRFSQIASVVVAIAGSAVLLGWFLDIQILKSILPGLVTMKANTACAFVAAGSAMWLLNVNTAACRITAYALVAVVIAIGGLTSTEYLFSSNFGIDQIILPDYTQAANTPFPGRMAPVTAVNFCLIGFALLTLPHSSQTIASTSTHWIALPVGIASMLAAVGYTFGANAMSAFGQFFMMAIHTALLFAMLYLAIICAHPSQGIMSIAVSDTTGGIVCRRLLPTLPLMLFALGWVRLTAPAESFFGTRSGLASVVVAGMAVAALAITWTVTTLHKIDLRREGVEAELIALNAKLETRVQARTAELARSLELEVAERRRAELSESKLELSERYLDFALASHHLGAWTLDLKSNRAHRTLIHDQIFGYSEILPTWTFEIFLEHVIPADRSEVERSFRLALATHSDWTFTCRIRRADGAIRNILAAGTHRKDSEGSTFAIQGLVQDITERKHTEEVQQRLAALVEFAEDAIVTESLDGVVRTWNPAAERLLQYRADEIIGQHIAQLLPTDRQDEESIILDHLRKEERVSQFETVRCRKDGLPVHVSLSISPIRDHLGATVGISKIMRDISARKRAEENLRDINQDLERKNKDLDDFVYTASHDLRAPLTAVGTVAQWILDDDTALSADSHSRLALIKQRIERMKLLLNDIRDYARAGQYAEPSGPQLTAALLVKDIAATLPVKDHFSIRCDSSLEAVLVSRIPLELVLHNLIGNALKHHDQASGLVTVSVKATNRLLRFWVIDDGPGIPSEYRSAIFEMFKTLKGRDEVEGSGMGLALAKKIVERMGGACGVESTPGRGASFWFDWPQLEQSS
jgi:PAS domain S-box-containing protein